MSIVNSTITDRTPLLVSKDDTPVWWRGAVNAIFGPRVHPDNELRLVVYAFGDSMRVQIAAARVQLPQRLQRPLEKLAHELDHALDGDVPDFPAILGVDAALNALYPPEIAARRAWLIQERFKRVAASPAIAAWWLNDRDRVAAAGGQAALTNGRPAARDLDRAVNEARFAYARMQVAAQAAARDLEKAKDLLNAAQGALNDAPPTATDADRARSQTAVDAAQRAVTEASDAYDAANVTAEFEKQFLDAVVAAKVAAEAASAFDAAEAELRSAEAALKDITTGDTAAAQQAVNDATADRDAKRKDMLDKQIAAETAARTAKIDPDSLGYAAPPAADTQSLLSYIHANYVMAIASAKAERDIKSWLTRSFFGGLLIPIALMAPLCWLIGRHWPGQQGAVCSILGTLLVLATLGRIGALISISRRLQAAVVGNALERDAIHDLAAMSAGKPGIRMAMLSGSVFALLVYVLFASGIAASLGVGGGMFPQSRPTNAATDVANNTVDSAAALKKSISDRATALATSANNDSTKLEALQKATPCPADSTAGSNPASKAATTGGTESNDCAKARQAIADLKTKLDGERVQLATARTEADAASKVVTTGAVVPLPGNLRWVAYTLGFVGLGDLFKLLAWGFIAGFAERFVPDAIDSVVAKASARPSAPAAAAPPPPTTATAGMATAGTAK